MTEERSRPVGSAAEFRIMAALWRWSVPILLLTAIAAGAVWYTSRTAVPIRTVQSELLVRIGYEYSPVPWSSATETQQINFRADEVIGTEIQFLTSEETIKKAIAVAPHPLIAAAADGTLTAAQMLLVRKKLAVKQLQGSNVILVEVTDADEAWSVTFSQALLDAYLQNRRQLFSDQDYDNLLKQDEAASTAALAGLDDEVLQVSRRLAETSDYLAKTAESLSASPSQPELRASLAQDVRALRIFVGGMEHMSALQGSLDRLAQILSTTSAPATAAGAGNLVSDELLKQAVDQIAKDAARLNAIAGERDSQIRQLDTVRTAQLRKAMRDEASHNMTVMSPPRVLATPNGLDRVQRTVLAGLIALILSSLLFVYVDGLRRRSA